MRSSRARADENMVYSIGLESNYFIRQRMVRSKPDGGLRKISDDTGRGYFELKTARARRSYLASADKYQAGVK